MNNLEQAFDPALSIFNPRQFADKSNTGINNPAEYRTLFYQLNQAQPAKDNEIIPKAYGFISQSLKDAEQVYSSFIIQNYDQGKFTTLHAKKIEPLPDALLTQNNLYQCINQTAPVLLTQPCWLQNISQISWSQAVFAINMMSIYLQLTRGQGKNDLQKSVHSLLLATDTGMPNMHSYSYSQQPEILTEMFDFADTQLALAKFPRVFFPEILGFTLAYLQSPTLIELCFPNHQLPSIFFKTHHHRLEKQLATLKTCISDYLDLYFNKEPETWKRIQHGFWLYQLKTKRCRDRLLNLFQQPHSSQQAISKVFQKKAMAAIGHHQKIQLQGKNLDVWFAEMPQNSCDFLKALRQSTYVDKQKPEKSRLLKLFAFKGPMYGVLDESEQLVLLNWLQDELSEEITTPSEEKENSASSMQPLESTRPAKKYSKPSNRELYYYLVNEDTFPDILPVAKARVSKLLQACAFFNPPPFKNYSHEQLDSYIENSYQKEMNAYHPLQGKPRISKEAYIWGLEQIAPMILIDGCWLQNSLDLQNAYPEISDILFSIYCDEIGNGLLEKNHPYIFQQLLDSLSIRVPSVTSTKFIDHKGFLNSAFDLPVYMLSLSQFTVELLPELLGLNMAIELSGLGNGYMTLVDELNYWEIDPTIANIHISIDNYASGHTFLAKKAIQLYMDEVMQRTAERKVVDKHWRRTYSGYASLRFVGGLFKRGLPVWYLIYKLRGINNLRLARK